MSIRLSKQVFAWLLLALCAAAIPVGIISKSHANHFREGDVNSQLDLFTRYEDRIVVLDLNGLITGEEDDQAFGPSGSASHLARQLRKAVKDTHTKAILLRINSPGGTVATSQELHDLLLSLKQKGKPVVVSMGDVAASGGYYTACAADKIVAEPGTLTGSIGVIMHLLNAQGIEKKLGLEPGVVKSGKFKDIGSIDRPMTADERAIVESIIQDSYDQFTQAVAEGRHMDIDAIKKLADGRVWTGKQALALGLVDQLGGYTDALASLQKMCREKYGYTSDLPVDDKRSKGFLSSLLQSSSSSQLSQLNVFESLLGKVGVSKQPLWLYE